jgi:RNA polymerase sigma-70 factor (ECF subfamily)
MQSDAVEDRMPRDDAELLAKASLGDQSAFGALYNKYHTDLYRFAFYLSGGPEAAEELFQETWYRAVKNLGKKQIINFKQWLFAVAANLHKDELRKQKVRRLFLGKEAGGGPGTERATAGSVPAPEQFMIQEELSKAMKHLTHRQRTIFILTYVEGFKIREVCEMLGKAEGTVKSTLHRAVTILREELKEFR